MLVTNSLNDYNLGCWKLTLLTGTVLIIISEYESDLICFKRFKSASDQSPFVNCPGDAFEIMYSSLTL